MDFYCHKAKLAVELDGSQHYEPEAQAYDQRRMAYLRTQGVEVLRFANSEVLEQFRGVCEQIHATAEHRFPRGEAVERMRD